MGLKFLVVVDAHTKWLEVTISAAKTIEVLRTELWPTPEAGL